MIDDAPTTNPMPDETPAAPARGQVVVLNRDLFFGIRIVDTLRRVGYAVAIVPTSQDFAERLRTSQPPAVLGIVDLGAGPDWELLRPQLAAPTTATPILAFGPHKDVDAMRAAKAAGVTRLVPHPLGAACELHDDCASGFSADRVCCDERCDGECRACGPTDLSPAGGTCQPLTDGQCVSCQGENQRCGGSANYGTCCDGLYCEGGASLLPVRCVDPGF